MLRHVIPDVGVERLLGNGDGGQIVKLRVGGTFMYCTRCMRLGLDFG